MEEMARVVSTGCVNHLVEVPLADDSSVVPAGRVTVKRLIFPLISLIDASAFEIELTAHLQFSSGLSENLIEKAPKATSH